MMQQVIAPDNVHPAKGYSHAIKVGNTIYVAGQIARDEQGKIVGEHDIIAQTEQAYGNLKRVLEAAGASMKNIVKLNFFCKDVDGFRKTREARRKYLGDHYPATTVVQIDRLDVPECLVEIEAIAVID